MQQNSKTSQVFKLKIMNYKRLEESSSDFIYTVGERKKKSQSHEEKIEMFFQYL